MAGGGGGGARRFGAESVDRVRVAMVKGWSLSLMRSRVGFNPIPILHTASQYILIPNIAYREPKRAPPFFVIITAQLAGCSWRTALYVTVKV